MVRVLLDQIQLDFAGCPLAGSWEDLLRIIEALAAKVAQLKLHTAVAEACWWQVRHGQEVQLQGCGLLALEGAVDAGVAQAWP